jgi:hypothetical protein
LANTLTGMPLKITPNQGMEPTRYTARLMRGR